MVKRAREDYQVHKSDIVWAKIAGYPWWPGKITCEPTTTKRFTVLFYGDRTIAYLPIAKIIPFKSHRIFLPVKRSLLQTAFFEAVEEYGLISQDLDCTSVSVTEQSQNVSLDSGKLCTQRTHPEPKANSPSDADSNITEAVKLKSLREEWDKMIEKPLKMLNVINLKNMSNSEVVNTFQWHENILKEIFRNNLQIPDRQVEMHSKLDYLLILDTTVTSAQQVAMYKILRKNLTSATNFDISTNHENLLWKIVLPEWCVNILMKKFNLSHEETIQYLKLQEQQQIENSEKFEIDV